MRYIVAPFTDVTKSGEEISTQGRQRGRIHEMYQRGMHKRGLNTAFSLALILKYYYWTLQS